MFNRSGGHDSCCLGQGRVRVCGSVLTRFLCDDCVVGLVQTSSASDINRDHEIANALAIAEPKRQTRGQRTLVIITSHVYQDAHTDHARARNRM